MADELWSAEIGVSIRLRADTAELAERLMSQAVDDTLSHLNERLKAISDDSIAEHRTVRGIHPAAG